MLTRQDGKVRLPFCQVKEHLGVPQPGLPGLVRLRQAVGGVLADGLQQPVPGPARSRLGDDEGLAGQPVHHIQRGRLIPLPAHRGGRGQAEASREHRELTEYPGFLCGQQVITPADRGLQGLVAPAGDRPTVGQEPGLIRQVGLDLLYRQRTGTGGGQLDRQRQPIQRAADPGHHRHRRGRRPASSPGRRRAVQEQPYCRRPRQGLRTGRLWRHRQRR